LTQAALSSGDTAWVLTSSALVLLSQHGEQAYFGSDLGSAAGAGGSLGGSGSSKTWRGADPNGGSQRLMRARLITATV